MTVLPPCLFSPFDLQNFCILTLMQLLCQPHQRDFLMKTPYFTARPGLRCSFLSASTKNIHYFADLFTKNAKWVSVELKAGSARARNAVYAGCQARGFVWKNPDRYFLHLVYGCGVGCGCSIIQPLNLTTLVFAKQVFATWMSFVV